ncbi:hypothetical protein M409DRAFT_21219 [Zasmidium cellare ATCC 36951]|uniref:Uncharacterized protein n=1 Tax=Zasmidium cellare ATCC 36951 TaxID=1080233 RepID=A0A6A6CRR1_ZASCE|nr:uncharacterized protein M409DRAFT_21219 [Zasmidium cellare ATCC 36951]KAF2168469.1 hypothetical protein M409DRAFT_21219 [Zasmidium cellare ATCC 36951]
MPLEVFFHFYPALLSFAVLARAPAFPPPPPPPSPSDDDDGLIDLDEADPDLRPAPPVVHWRSACDAVLNPAWNPATDPLPAPGIEHVDLGENGLTVHTYTIHGPGAVWVGFCVRIHGDRVADFCIFRNSVRQLNPGPYIQSMRERWAQPGWYLQKERHGQGHRMDIRTPLAMAD